MTDNPQHVNPGLDATFNPIVIDDSYRQKKDIPIETVVELNETIRKLKRHLQELKGVSLKVVSDCESLSITLASNKAKQNIPPTPEEEPCRNCPYAILCSECKPRKEHDDSIYNTALDDVREALSYIRFQDEDTWFIEAAIKKIESLRKHKMIEEAEKRAGGKE